MKQVISHDLALISISLIASAIFPIQLKADEFLAVDTASLYLVEGWFAGPFPGGSENFDKPMGPELTISTGFDKDATFDAKDGTTTGWTFVRSWRSTIHGPRAIEMIGATFEHSQVSRPSEEPITAYFLTQLEADEPVSATIDLELTDTGSPASKIFVNGKPVEGAGAELQQGINTLLVKITQQETIEGDDGTGMKLRVESQVDAEGVAKVFYLGQDGSRLPVNAVPGMKGVRAEMRDGGLVSINAE